MHDTVPVDPLPDGRGEVVVDGRVGVSPLVIGRGMLAEGRTGVGTCSVFADGSVWEPATGAPSPATDSEHAAAARTAAQLKKTPTRVRTRPVRIGLFYPIS